MTLDIRDTGERIIPASAGEVSFVFSRHKFAYEYVQQFVENRTVLDVGCGTGYGCKILSEKAKLVYGIDSDAEAVAYSKRHYAAPNIEYMQMDAPLLDLDRQFDVAIAFQVIEHLPNPHGFIQGLKSQVRPEGTIYISTPNVAIPLGAKEKNPFHLNEMNYVEFEELLSKSFSTFEILGIDYAARNRLRALLSKTPLYTLGRLLKRKSRLKKMAGMVLQMTNFKIISSDIEKEAGDLLAICKND